MGIQDSVGCANTQASSVNIPSFGNSTNVTLTKCVDDGDSVMTFAGAFANDVTRFGIFAIMLLFGVITVLGNIVIISCVVTSRRLNCTNFSVYVVSLALADMLVGAICIPATAVYTCYGYWPLGNAVCTAFFVFDCVCCAASNMHLDVIAYDRYRAVTDPLIYRSKFTKSRARKLALVPWMLAALYFIPGVVVVRIRDETRGIVIPDQCSYPLNVIYFVGCTLFSTYAPSVCLIVLYVFVVIAIRRRNGPRTILGDKKGRSKDLPVSTDREMGGERDKISEQNRRCLFTLLAQIVLFLICWLPWMAVLAVLGFCSTCVPATVFDVAYWMVYANSTVNPMIYLVFNKDYRNVFIAMICRSKKG